MTSGVKAVSAAVPLTRLLELLPAGDVAATGIENTKATSTKGITTGDVVGLGDAPAESEAVADRVVDPVPEFEFE